jgi:tetratricopeptide (TPR) repeat protein
MKNPSSPCPALAALWRGAALFALGACCLVAFAEPGPGPAIPARAEETNAPDVSWLQVQEQLHDTQLALERNRLEAEAAATRNAEALGSRLQGIEQAVAAQRTQELEAMQSSNRAMLMVAGSFAALGVLAILLTAYFQWRTVSRLTELSAALPLGHPFGAGDTHALGLGTAQESNQRLLGSLDRLEQRILQLEQTGRLPLDDASHREPDGALLPPGSGAASTNPESAAIPATARITLWLGKGQSLLNLDQPEQALACFEEALALDPNHAEALVKKGAALEVLRRLDEAVTSYDRAIAADSSLTVAYLYKGGLCNRMERFSEALECYEKALRTQEARRT